MLLGEASSLASEITAAIPDDPNASATPTGNPWVDAISARIREIETW